MNEKQNPEFRCGYVALLGRPNVGKSTLLNNILKFKLSIVTPKPQTTRHKILGIHSDDDSQMIFFDTPGVISPRYKLHEFLVRAAENAAAGADLLVFMIDVKDADGLANEQILEKFSKYDKPTIICLNKIDLVAKEKLLPMIERFAKIKSGAEIIPVSAIKSDGVDSLLQTIKKNLPKSPPLYPPDQLTTAPERFFVSEIVREKIFMSYGEEIPYSTTVEIEEFKERKKGKTYIRAAIFVERDSQKGILIGKGGSALKRAGATSRADIEKFLQKPVYLELVVLVRPKWREKESMLDQLGYRPA